MTKKKPIQNSDPSINFRLPQELKEIIKTKAEEKNATISNYIRDLLEEVHSGEYCKKEEAKNRLESFLYSKDFLRLIIWIYKKRLNKKLEVEKHELDGYLRTLKRVEGHLPKNLVNEFDKVLNDILIVKADQSAYGIDFSFHDAFYETKKVDLKLIEQFFLQNEYLEDFIKIGGPITLEIDDFRGIQL